MRGPIFRLTVLMFMCITAALVMFNLLSLHHLRQARDVLGSKFPKDAESKYTVVKGQVTPATVPEEKEAVFQDGKIGEYEHLHGRDKNGPGEGGKPLYPSRGHKPNIADYGCDMAISDMISLHRSIPDTRHPECKYWHYPKELPTASVVIVFYNEGNSTLLRTVHSAIDRSPPSLLSEVVLVDDGSTKDHLKEPLEEYIQQFNGKVKLYRNKERLGLIGARMRGAEEAIGDVIVVLDAHCECNINWLPPLLQRIALNRKTLAQPVVDFIKYDDFQYYPLYGRTLPKGIFDWGLLYKEMNVPAAEQAKRTHKTEPYGTPTHAGGLFAVDKKYFFEIGGYDDNILVWGGENFQLSFKLWMCGGRVEMVPCSRVGHVYHAFMPYSMQVEKSKHLKISAHNHNYVRVVEGWMDEYREYFYIREPQLQSYHVNVTDQLELRKRLGCKSFKWFMDNVAVGLLGNYPVPLPNVAWGKIRERYGRRCMMEQAQLGSCHSIFRLNTAGNIASGEYCLAVIKHTRQIVMPKCPDSSKERWDWNRETGLIRHPTFNMCVKGSSKTSDLSLIECNKNDERQQFDMIEGPR